MEREGEEEKGGMWDERERSNLMQTPRSIWASIPKEKGWVNPIQLHRLHLGNKISTETMSGILDDMRE